MRKSLVHSTTFLLKQCTGTRTSGSVLRTFPFYGRTRTPVFGTATASRSRPLSSSSSSASTISDRGGAILRGSAPISSNTDTDKDSTIEIHLPPADDPVGLALYKKAIYCPVSQVLRTSAHVGSDDDNQKADGIVGDAVTPEEAKTHARNSGLRLLATIHHYLDGDLGRVEQVLHLKGLVKSTPEFSGHAAVIDGCSEVLAEAFGPDKGVGTRECFGVGSLGATVACTLELRIRPPLDIEK